MDLYQASITSNLVEISNSQRVQYGTTGLPDTTLNDINSGNFELTMEWIGAVNESLYDTDILVFEVFANAIYNGIYFFLSFSNKIQILQQLI